MEKSKIKRMLKIAFWLVMLILFFPVLLIPFNPMRRPQPYLTNHILRLTPIGMCIDDVIAVVENNNHWGRPSVSRTSGFVHPRRYVPGWPVFSLTGTSIIGDKSVQVFVNPLRPSSIPVFGLLMETSMTIFWGFDEEGKLIEIYVRVGHRLA